MLDREEKLRQEIYNFERIAEDRKTKRVTKTFIVLSIIVYLAALKSGEMNCIQDYLGWIIVAPVIAGLFMFLDMLVMLYVVSGAMNDEKHLARLQGKLDEIQSTGKDVQRGGNHGKD